MTPKRLIDIETLKTGSALLEAHRKESKPSAARSAAYAWLNWAADNSGDIMAALTAYASLEGIMAVTEITGLAYDPNYKWVLAVEKRDANGDLQEWTASCLEHVLITAAMDLEEISNGKRGAR